MKLGIVPLVFFCSQTCFGAAWKEHKKLHKIARARLKAAAADATPEGASTVVPAAVYAPLVLIGLLVLSSVLSALVGGKKKKVGWTSIGLDIERWWRRGSWYACCSH